VDHEVESALPYYGLAAGFVGERRLEGAGWDINVVGHGVPARGRELRVGVARRATVQVSGSAVRKPVTPELARFSVAVDLAMASGAVEPVSLASELAVIDKGWTPIELVVDGEQIQGHEFRHGDTFAIECIYAQVIISVVGPLGIRPGVIELEKLSFDDESVRAKGASG
jgi:hypothetical protein